MIVNKNKALVVCSDMPLCDQLRIYLEREGYNVIFSNDGLNAANVFCSDAPYFVILDKELSKVDSTDRKSVV